MPTCSDEELVALDSQTKQVMRALLTLRTQMLVTLIKLVVAQVEEEVRESKEALKKVQGKLLQLGSSLTLHQATDQLSKVV